MRMYACMYVGKYVCMYVCIYGSMCVYVRNSARVYGCLLFMSQVCNNVCMNMYV